MLNETDLSRVDLNLLVLFDVVNSERHVGRAAARMHVSPSAISHGLGRLRALLGDPLFLKNPKGVVPTARAEALAEPVAEALRAARRVVGRVERFEPRSSTRRFVVGATDGITGMLLLPLVARLVEVAPGIDIALRDVLPPWQDALADLDTRTLDVALLPLEEVPARFVARQLIHEQFVVAMRRGHPLGRAPSLARYCAAEHVLVSRSGDPRGMVDEALAARGHQRRVALTVPSFLLALAVVAESDMVSAVPRGLFRAQARRFGLVAGKPPVSAGSAWLRAVVPRVALADEGIAWLVDTLAAVAAASAV
jgi:DNA-binding transcriptional LysR family regulator